VGDSSELADVPEQLLEGLSDVVKELVRHAWSVPVPTLKAPAFATEVELPISN
jgi:hypothetical protein